MKLYRNAIILVVIVALMVGAYFIVSKNKSSTGGTGNSSSDVIKLTDYTTDKISQVTVESPDQGTIVIVKNGTDWKLSSPTDWTADPSKLSSIVINAGSMMADKLVTKNAGDLAQYGLDKPVTATIKLTDGTEKIVKVGGTTPTKDDYYVMMSGSSNVYTVSSYTAESILYKKNDIMDKTLYTLKSDDITTFGMIRKGQSIFTSKKTSSTNWTMQTPIQGDVDTASLQPMLDAVSGTTASAYIDTNATDLSQYGLKNPSYELDFGTSSASYKLLLGDEQTKGSQYYAMLAGTNKVFTIDETNYTFLDKPLKEILSIFAYIVNIDQVNKIDLTMDGQTTTMTLDVYKAKDGTQDADKDKFTVNGKDASGKNKDDKQPFREFYQALIGIGLDNIEPDAVPAGNPEISIKYYLKSDPGTMTVDFIPKDANNYYVVRNGVYAGITVRKDKQDFGIAGMKASFKTMMDFLNGQK